MARLWYAVHHNVNTILYSIFLSVIHGVGESSTINTHLMLPVGSKTCGKHTRDRVAFLPAGWSRSNRYSIVLFGGFWLETIYAKKRFSRVHKHKVTLMFLEIM